MRTDFDIRAKFSKGSMPPRNKKNFRPTKSGAGMTQAGVKAYRRLNPGSKLKTAVNWKSEARIKSCQTQKIILRKITRATKKSISKNS